jgi:hypothetical protein
MSVPGLRREDFPVLDRLTYLNTASAGLVPASVVTPAHAFELELAQAGTTGMDEDTEIGILPPWFRVKTRWHDDRWQPGRLMSWAGAAAAKLALISGTTAPAIRNALPAFGTRPGPARAATACRCCTATRGIRQPVPVHLPAHHQVCLSHGIWLSGAGTPQFSVSECPDIMAAERQARRLLRRCTIEQLIHARIQAAQPPGSPAQPGSQTAWKRRMHALITSNPRTVIESCPQELFTAAGYPETVSTSARMIPVLAVSNGKPETHHAWITL